MSDVLSPLRAAINARDLMSYGLFAILAVMPYPGYQSI